MKLLLPSLLTLIAVSGLCSASNILLLMLMPSRSHYHLGERLSEELVKRGHKVTIMSPYKRSEPFQNITEIILPDLSKELFDSVNTNTGDGRFSMRMMSTLAFFDLSPAGEQLVDKSLGSEVAQRLINSNQEFDLIVGDSFLMESVLAGFSYRFKAPMVAIAPFLPNTWVYELIGNPYPASYVPDTVLGYTNKMNFQERLINLLYTTLSQIYFYQLHLTRQDGVMRKYFGKDMPYITDLLKNTSLMLENHHYSLAFPRPHLPNVIEIGGSHVKPPKPLPKDLQKFMDEAKEGVIYFSMGSNLKSAEFPKEKFDGILRAFSRLKQKVLWKFENENPPNLPKNVKISKWLPQTDILAHPNTKIFITHGGLLSITESVLRGVPVIGIPVFADQPLNVKYILMMESGVQVEYDELGEETLYNAIQEILNNPKYTKNMKARSAMLQDVPMLQMDSAIYWIEYVIRYKGAPHLKSGAQDLAWYQLYLLDVYAFLAVVASAALFIVYKCLCFVSRTVCGGGKRKDVSRQKKHN